MFSSGCLWYSWWPPFASLWLHWDALGSLGRLGLLSWILITSWTSIPPNGPQVPNLRTKDGCPEHIPGERDRLREREGEIKRERERDTKRTNKQRKNETKNIRRKGGLLHQRACCKDKEMRIQHVDPDFRKLIMTALQQVGAKVHLEQDAIIVQPMAGINEGMEYRAIRGKFR